MVHKGNFVSADETSVLESISDKKTATSVGNTNRSAHKILNQSCKPRRSIRTSQKRQRIGERKPSFPSKPRYVNHDTQSHRCSACFPSQ